MRLISGGLECRSSRAEDVRAQISCEKYRAFMPLSTAWSSCIKERIWRSTGLPIRDRALMVLGAGKK